MPKYPFVNIITSQCLPEDEERFNKWYNEVHVPMLMKFKGIKSAARLKVTSEKHDKPRFIAIYKFDSKQDFEAFGKSPEYKAAMDELHERWGPQGLDILSRVQHDLLKEWKGEV